MITFHCTAHSFLIVHALFHPVNFLQLFHSSLSHFLCFLIFKQLDSMPLANSHLHPCWSLCPLKDWSGSIILVCHDVLSLLFLFWIVTSFHLGGFSSWHTWQFEFQGPFCLLQCYHLLIHWNPLVCGANFRGSTNLLSCCTHTPIHFTTSFHFTLVQLVWLVSAIVLLMQFTTSCTTSSPLHVSLHYTFDLVPNVFKLDSFCL